MNIMLEELLKFGERLGLNKSRAEEVLLIARQHGRDTQVPFEWVKAIGNDNNLTGLEKSFASFVVGGIITGTPQNKHGPPEPPDTEPPVCRDVMFQ